MENMFDRVAQAIYEANFDAPNRRAVMWKDDIYKEHYRKLARAAIGAMREPTEAMKAAYWDEDTVGYGADPSDHDAVWRAGIDVALKEG